MSRWLSALCMFVMAVSCSSNEPPASDRGLDVAQQLAELRALPAPQGVPPGEWAQLKGALAAYLTAHYPSGKIPAATATSLLAATQLSLDDPNDQLEWRFASPGDYDQNGEVNISDLSALGAHLGEASGGGPFPFETAQSVIDGDNNGEINISDITPIGANIGKRVLQYNVFCSPSEADYPASNGEATKVDPVGTIPLDVATGDRTSERLAFEFGLVIDTSAFYWVRPSDGTDNGTPSNKLAPVVPTFASVSINASSPNNEGTHNSLAALASGNPAISYHSEAPEGDLLYAYSSTADGSGGWTSRSIDTTGDTGWYTSLALNGAGNPAIAYYEGTNADLKYAYSDNADGSGTWTIVTVDSLNITGQSPSLALINGFPAISYWYTQSADLRYAYSSQADGSAGWTIVDVDTAGVVGQYNSLADVNGFPAISYWDGSNFDLRYAHSSQPDGSSGWTSVIADATGDTGYYNSLEEVNGFPAIGYYDHNTFGLNYAYSSLPDGSGGWTSVSVDDVNDSGGYCSLALINGKPAISYFNSTFGQLRYAFSSVADGSAGWSNTLVDGAAGGLYSSLAAIDGKPGISYYHSTDTALKYAWLQ